MAGDTMMSPMSRLLHMRPRSHLPGVFLSTDLTPTVLLLLSSRPTTTPATNNVRHNHQLPNPHVPEVAPVVKYDDLRTSTTSITAEHDRVMNRDVTEDVPRSIKEIADIMRAMFLRFGYVSVVDDNRELTGPLSKQSLINKYDKRNTGVVTGIRKMVNTDAYGKDSFIVRFVEGIISKESCFVKITNWDLHAKACRLDGDNDKAAEYEGAIAELHIVKLSKRLASSLKPADPGERSTRPKSSVTPYARNSKMSSSQPLPISR
ncbi:hypothetical protein FB567DRAFT_593813 [Paraphoma chrysanthemicola]|uniref:CBS domain-containing protein n=1 Tax=Paraphoma chrysanthemicola TaxID=798071 RepID=A0A8K0R1V2_9PLEO|nr:hypothetical protein FB567DRAFT_593813 [Paraphoma chrysanthemicola]